MQKLKNIIFITLSYIIIFGYLASIQGCSSDKNIIDKDKMAQIISQMYLADIYIDNKPQLRAQTDSLYLYSPIIEKFGYTIDDYKRSVNYYIQKGNSYYKINVAAKDLLKSEQTKIAEIIAKQNKTFLNWWAIDSLKSLDYNKLIYFPEIRSIKWILNYDKFSGWKVGDSLITDIPQNITWWENNYNITQIDSIINKYNVLTKDYVIREENNKKNENNKCELHIPDKWETDKKRLLEGKR